MTWRWIRPLAVYMSLAFAGNGFAATELEGQLQAELYAGQTARAIEIAETRLAQTPDDDQARFALGVAQFLQAVEHLEQALYRYGLASGEYRPGFGLAGLPILRIPVPDNPDPDELTFEAFRGVLENFVLDLAAAETTLSEIGEQQIDLALNIGLIRLDLDGDGTGSEEEALWRVFKVVAGAGWLDESAAQRLLTDFDAGDVPWIQGYTHLLRAIAEFVLAHDWQEAFEVTFPTLFEMPSSPYSKLDQYMPLPPYNPQNLPRWEWWESEESRQYDSVLNQRKKQAFFDLIAFIHLNHWPVVEPDRMRNVLRHLETMVELSRENWRRIFAETDDRAEWIPNPRQTGVLPRMQVTQERIDGWLAFLDEFEAILQGKKLIPHWRFDEGINMRRLFLEPRTFDIVLLIQGSAALPYLENGEFASGETWWQIMQIFGGDFFRYFVWFN